MKGLQYKTIWVEFPDIEPLCKKIGAKPTNTKVARYTVPVIHDPSTNAVVSNSIDIARYLDATYPSTTRLFPPGSDALQEAFQDAYIRTIQPVLPMLQSLFCAKLNPVSEAYIREKIETRLGKRIEEVTAPGPQRDKHWKLVQEAYQVIDSWLAKSGDGKPFVMGDTISYADITIAAFLLWIREVFGPESREWKDIERWHGGRWAIFVAHFAKIPDSDVLPTFL